MVYSREPRRQYGGVMFRYVVIRHQIVRRKVESRAQSVSLLLNPRISTPVINARSAAYLLSDIRSINSRVGASGYVRFK
jgi:hypothetical protein